jgi:hypothetical protein
LNLRKDGIEKCGCKKSLFTDLTAKSLNYRRAPKRETKLFDLFKRCPLGAR